MSGRGRTEGLLRDEAKRHRWSLAAAGAAAGAGAAGGALLLGVSGWFLAAAAAAGSAGPAAVAAFNYLLPSAAFRLFAIARTGGRYGERLFAHQAALRALAAVRPALFAGLAAAPPEISLALSSGEASARLVQDVDALESRMVRRSAPFAALAGAGAAAACVAFASPWAALAFGLGLAGQQGLGRRLAGRWTDAPAREGLEAVGRLKSGLAAYVGAAAELRVFGLGERALAALMRHDAALGGAAERRANAEARLGVVEAAAPALTLAAVALLCRSRPAPLAALADLATLAGFEAASGLLRAAEQAGAVRAASARLDALAPASRAPAAASGPVSADLTIDGVALAPGSRVALVGPSGSGKTRTLEALLGLRAVPAGRFRVADAPLERAPVGFARPLFAYAPQDARMLTGAVAENLRLGAPGADDAALWSALEDAGLAARVRAMPDGLGAWIGEGGETLSGGERRRLALARAYLRPAPWLMLDEPTEGLDARTEAAVVAALDRRLARTGQGLILVSHRPAPLALCALRIDVAGSA